MRFGDSIRRKRGGGGRGRAAGGPPRWGGPGALRRVLAPFGLIAAGWVSGEWVATRWVFPLPETGREAEGMLEVPDLDRITLGEALAALEEGGLMPGVVDTLLHPEAPEGAVIGQSPLPGQLALPGAEVRLSVSGGPDQRALPVVTGLGGERARALLESTGFLVRVDTVPSDQPRGVVLAQVPEGDRRVRIPAEVRLEVSEGPIRVEVPDLVGLDLPEAERIVDELGLVLAGVEMRFNFGEGEGTVIEQRPPAGEWLERGGAVRLVAGREE